MQGLYIASTSARAGKTLLTCSLGVLLQKRGHKIGFIKPLGSQLKRVEAGNGDADAIIVQEVLGQDVKPEVLTPIMIPAWSSLLLYQHDNNVANTISLVKKSYAQISRGKDIMLVSGTHAAPFSGTFAGMDSFTLTKELNLRVLLIERYMDGLINYDSLLFIKEMLGDKLAGVVINDVPESEISALNSFMVPFLQGNGIKVLGLIPHEPKLRSIRSMDLAYDLGGRIVAGNKHASNMVEGFLIGTMQVDNFMSHLRSNPRRAVIVGGDRSDLQLAALQGKAPCIILTGNIGPHELIRAKAEAEGVPLIVAKEDSYVVARKMSVILSAQKFHELSKIRAGVALVEQSLNMDYLMESCFGGKNGKRKK